LRPALKGSLTGVGEVTADITHMPQMAGILPKALDNVRSDLAEVAKIHCAAFPSSVLSELGEEIIFDYYTWLTRTPHTLKFITSSSESGQIDGYVAVIIRPHLSGFVLRHVPKLFRAFFRSNPLAVIRVLGKLQGNWWRKATASRQTPDPALATLLAIAVIPSSQGRGVGRKLEQQAVQAAVLAGFEGLDLYVHVGNSNAIKFYEGLGWQRDASSRGRSLRMVKRWA
jgi:ribosomal protein S18 acetylase RimI-like enzyme